MKLIKIYPRGFCAGVERAVKIVDKALDKFPEKKIFVKHEIVHNADVVNDFKRKGVNFIEDLESIDEDDILIFSAHGVSNNFKKQANDSLLFTIDATCPLVNKVHNYIENNDKKEDLILIIGDKKHVEVKAVHDNIVHSDKIIIKTLDDAKKIQIKKKYDKIHCITQTTLSRYETENIIAFLKNKFQNIITSDEGNVCYATTNRQTAVMKALNLIDFLLVIGGVNSSNSNKLADVARSKGVDSILISNINEVDFTLLKKYNTIGITSGASTPELTFNEIVDLIENYFFIKSEEFFYKDENVLFSLPKILR